MKRFISLFVALAVVLSMMTITASAQEVEPYVEIGVTCTSCGGACVFEYSGTNFGQDLYVYNCALTNGLHLHTRYSKIDVYTCRSCGKENRAATPLYDYCHVAGESISF